MHSGRTPGTVREVDRNAEDKIPFPQVDDTQRNISWITSATMPKDLCNRRQRGGLAEKIRKPKLRTHDPPHLTINTIPYTRTSKGHSKHPQESQTTQEPCLEDSADITKGY